MNIKHNIKHIALTLGLGLGLAAAVIPAITQAQGTNANQQIEMSVVQTKNLQAVKTFFDGLEHHELSDVEPLLAPNVIEIVPFSNTGSPKPWRTYDGKEAVFGYLNAIIKNFSQTVLLEKQFTVSGDGNVVFMEAKGDLIHAASGAAYNNLYVFKFTFVDGQIVHISEYANPVPFALLTGTPLGNPE